MVIVPRVLHSLTMARWVGWTLPAPPEGRGGSLDEDIEDIWGTAPWESSNGQMAQRNNGTTGNGRNRRGIDPKLATPLVISSIILSVIRWVPCGPSFGHSFEILLAIRSNYSTIQFCEEVNNFEPYSPGDNTNCKGPCKVLRGWCISFKIS